MPPCASLTISAAVVTAAMAMPTMPNRLPRIELVGWLRPLSDWMKQTLAIRYSSVTRFRLMSLPLDLLGGGLLPLEHLQHSPRDEEAAEDVHRRERHGEHAHGLAERAFGECRRQHRA